MDKLNPVFQPTPLTPQVAANVSSWYVTESTIVYSTAELPWLTAQGWKVYYANLVNPALPVYGLSRRIIKPELVLRELIADYTAAYNEGRQLNDQRYDDLVVFYTSILDKTEDALNTAASDSYSDANYKAALEAIIAAMQAAFAAYDTDVSDDLNAWGASLIAEVTARFAVEDSKAAQGLIDRGLYSGVLPGNASASVARELTRAMAITSDQVQQRKTELKSRVYDQGADMRSRILAAYERLRERLAGVLERRLTLRNGAAEALARFVERRDDGYPDLNEIGKLAASLGAGSPEAAAP